MDYWLKKLRKLRVILERVAVLIRILDPEDPTEPREVPREQKRP